MLRKFIFACALFMGTLLFSAACVPEASAQYYGYNYAAYYPYYASYYYGYPSYYGGYYGYPSYYGGYYRYPAYYRAPAYYGSYYYGYPAYYGGYRSGYRNYWR